MIENKIARICWNSEGWRKPSGRKGKSKNKKSYEYRTGFGSEEWLLDTSKLIDGWHYSQLQPIWLRRSKYIGKSFNVSLYSIDHDTRRRWWIGQICDVEVITEEQSRKVFRAYEKKGWINEMGEQLRSVNAAFKEFRKSKPEHFVIIRFRPQSLILLDTPKEFSRTDAAVKSTYYVLLNQKRVPKLQSTEGQFKFLAGHKTKKQVAKAAYEEHSGSIDLIQNKIQEAIFHQFVKEYGKSNVGTENDAGNGSEIDLVVRVAAENFDFYEIKTSYSVRLNIREGLGQLLEYAYCPPVKGVRKLIVVSDKPITDEAKCYLEALRGQFNLPVYYQRFDPETSTLETTLY